MHYTADARDTLDRLQRERIALLEGFDEKRAGLVGTWLAYNAVIEVTANEDGSLKAKGWKWEQGDRRRLDNSSTARLFPARPSPDIDNLGSSVIR
jgi:hypothetical protein